MTRSQLCLMAKLSDRNKSDFTQPIFSNDQFESLRRLFISD